MGFMDVWMEWISWHGKWKCMEMCLNVWMKWNGAHGKGLVFVNEALFLWIKISLGRGMVDVFIG